MFLIMRLALMPVNTAFVQAMNPPENWYARVPRPCFCQSPCRSHAAWLYVLDDDVLRDGI
jgi:hypothetical protein